MTSNCSPPAEKKKLAPRKDCQRTSRSRVPIGWFYSRTVWGRTQCTGSIVAPKVVLTAAHCVRSEGRLDAQLRVEVTLSEVSAPVEKAAVVAFAEHPQWRANDSASTDIALLFLDRNLTSAPIPMFSGNQDGLPNQPILAVGYGDNDGWQNTGAGLKRSTTMTYQRHFGTHFIAVSPPGRNTDTCQGDSGGPRPNEHWGLDPCCRCCFERARGLHGTYGIHLDSGTYAVDYCSIETRRRNPLQPLRSSSSSRNNSRSNNPSSSRSSLKTRCLDPMHPQWEMTAAPMQMTECDEPMYCRPGTDTSDCRGQTPQQPAPGARAPGSPIGQQTHLSWSGRGAHMPIRKRR